MSSTNPTPEAERKTLRVGVLGAGQLGRMLGLAGRALGLDFLFVDPVTETPPAACVGEHLALDYGSPAALDRLAACDVVTYEFENVPVAAAQALAGRTRVFPPVGALAVAQDRLHEKQCFSELGIPTPAFRDIASEDDLVRALAELGYPAVLKTRRFGYDGRGQAVLQTDADAKRAFAELGNVPLLLEGFVAFERELSLIGARSASGEVRFYPLVENHHRAGILRLTLAPAPNVAPERQALAEGYMRALFERLNYVGVLALELFQTGGRLVANEMAPRVHNSGHYSIEGARTSQFEQHLRAVLGLPLGSTELAEPSAMLNCVGALPDPSAVLAVPDAHLHDYGKAPRERRKVGHVTVRAPDVGTLADRLATLKAVVERSEFG
ncbi:MAG TPA: 5-(carboxyamino)imidazole ribonucleotide synthase [Polyangiaceae bacterium]|nr:5-(carboxyamino)imidazole ribonucleotide synthase [Polyangiaceae bacterium]